MNSPQTQTLSIAVDETRRVSGLFLGSARAHACYVLAHGAGAGMRHPFMESIASALAERNIATLRFQFPYMELGLKRPDTPKLAHLAIRAAVAEAARVAPGLPLFAGGKSFGGRMTSQAQAESPLPGVRGLVFLGFPLHPAGKPGVERAQHLSQVQIPMLFLQGTRDALANLGLMQDTTRKLVPCATLKVFEAADHSFHTPARTGRSDSEVRSEIVGATAEWMLAVIAGREPTL